MKFYRMSFENTLPKTLNNSRFIIQTKKILLFHVFQIVSTKSFSIVCLTRFDLTNFSVYLAKVHKHYMLGDSFLKNIISCGYNSILMYIKMIWFNRKINFKINKWIRKMTKF